jgi:hypothetical protein
MGKLAVQQCIGRKVVNADGLQLDIQCGQRNTAALDQAGSARGFAGAAENGENSHGWGFRSASWQWTAP